MGWVKDDERNKYSGRDEMKGMILGVILSLSLFGCDTSSDVELSTMEKFYFSQLQKWIDKGGKVETVQAEVIAPCSKLVTLTATSAENASFLSKTNIKEYDFRAGFCMKATVNMIHPQPEFKNRRKIESVCREKIKFFKIVCQYFKLP